MATVRSSRHIGPGETDWTNRSGRESKLEPAGSAGPIRSPRDKSLSLARGSPAPCPAAPGSARARDATRLPRADQAGGDGPDSAYRALRPQRPRSLTWPAQHSADIAAAPAHRPGLQHPRSARPTAAAAAAQPRGEPWAAGKTTRRPRPGPATPQACAAPPRQATPPGFGHAPHMTRPPQNARSAGSAPRPWPRFKRVLWLHCGRRGRPAALPLSPPSVPRSPPVC